MVRPVTVWVSVVDPALVSVPPEGLEATVYPVMTDPLLGGAVNETEAVVFPAVAVTDAGMPGTPTGVTILDPDEDELVPTAFTA